MEKVISRRKFLKNMAMAGGSTAAGLLLAEYLLERGFSGGLSGTAAAAAAPLWKAAASKNKIVVVSDLHFGISDRFAEQVDNRPLFIEFLQRLQNTTDVRELVIAGDFLDEWFLPLDYAPVTDMDGFFYAVARNNQPVIDALQAVMAAGIRLVYVVGNHDMNMETKILDTLLPGIVQPRDARGLGHYITGDRQEIVIEHSHRYDPYSAPDRVSNRELCGNDETMYPPGYFYARMGTSWVMQQRPRIAKKFPQLAHRPKAEDIDQQGAYIYAKTLEALFQRITPREGFADKVFNLEAAGFHGSYSLQDMYPVEQADGTISAPVLFRNFQRSWDERQRLNAMGRRIPFIDAAANAQKPDYFYRCARQQYWENPQQAREVVVFGHTHVPDFQQQGARYYLNTGTWVDHNSDYPTATRTFGVIGTGEQNQAALYMYNPDGTLTDLSGIGKK